MNMQICTLPYDASGKFSHGPIYRVVGTDNMFWNRGVVSADEITSLQPKQRKSWWPFGKKKPKEL